MAQTEPQAQLQKVQQYSDERADNDALYPFMRERNQAFVDVLCYLIGFGVVSEADLDKALSLARKTDDDIVQHIARQAVAR